MGFVMNINSPILAMKHEPRFLAKIKKVRYGCSIFILTVTALWNVAACSSISKTTLTGNEHLVCSPDIQFVNHNVTCEKKAQGGGLTNVR